MVHMSAHSRRFMSLKRQDEQPPGQGNTGSLGNTICFEKPFTTVGNTKARRGLCLRYPLIHQRVLNPRTLNQVPKYPVPNTWSSRARPFCNDGRVTFVASTRQPLLPCQRLEPKIWPKSSCETKQLTPSATIQQRVLS